MTKSVTKIQDKDTTRRLSVVRSTEDPTKYGVVILNPDGSRIRGPKGEPGEAATVEVGGTTTGNPGTNASVSNSGDSVHAILNFTIPRGATVSVGSTTTGNPGTSASVTNSGQDGDVILDFTIPKGEKGDTGTISVGTTTTGNPGTNASVTNSGTSTDAVFNFTIPKGEKGDKGDAATIQVGTTTTGSAGSNASVNNSGTSSNAIFNFVIPRGDKGETGDTGNGIINTTKNKVGRVTTVTFTYANGSVFDFSVSDGEDGEGSGDVIGPNSSTDGNIVVFDGTTGKLLKDSGKTIGGLESAISSNTTAISTINGKIPNEATASNQLADKNFVNSSINSVTAFYITRDAQGDQFATKAQLDATTVFYSGGVVRVPTRNDYCIVVADETHDNATTRYIYQNQWEFQYVVNETALTAQQLAALNSGITSGKVSQYDGYATNKQDKLVSGTSIKTINGTSILGSGDIETPNTTYSDATQSVAGLMSASDKTKLDGIEEQAQKNTVTGVKGSAESTYRQGNINITKANIGLGNVDNTSDANKPVSTATQNALNQKQDTLVSGTSIKTVNSISLLGSGNITLNDVKTSATAPSSPTEGMVWYDTTNDQLKVYDGTNWDVTGNEYNAGEGIEIGNVSDYSAMRGPAPRGFHVPTRDELVELVGILTTTFGLASNATTASSYLKMPMAGSRDNSTSNVVNQGSDGKYWSCINLGGGSVRGLSITSSTFGNTTFYYNSFGYSIRCFKDTPVTPDSSWTTLYDGSSIATGAGVFHNQLLGLISVSGDGQNWKTISDKNLGATTVYNSGDTLSEANCGKYYQWGNNYGFPRTGTVTTSSTQVDASSYGPGNYYSSSTFIIGYSTVWDNPTNRNLRGGQTGVVTLNNAIINIGVLSVNGMGGDVLVQAQHSSLTVTLTSAGWSNNGQTVSVSGVTASNTVIVSPSPSSMSEYTNAKVFCSAQGSNSLTFSCTDTPTSDIVVNVVILD